ncbi:hypothetical protein [Paenibacillus arenilitoris]|uniref:Uncharacterized protein n=1 Tax=Paenibacillus arenilitoris TaxID=2772299 RepID=A0A927CUP2_9BACL|nr:hypothetical protein [Paenibacillus arenilitoris]MBD2872186.1 hypothetical protein [Paenibacillus arenilitoris]
MSLAFCPYEKMPLSEVARTLGWIVIEPCLAEPRGMKSPSSSHKQQKTYRMHAVGSSCLAMAFPHRTDKLLGERFEVGV